MVFCQPRNRRGVPAETGEGCVRVVIEIITILAASFYASRSFAIGRAWRAARRTRGPGAALSEFRSGYGRAALLHSILAAVGSVGSVGAWYYSSHFAWLIGGLIIGETIPVTHRWMLPVSRKLLDASSELPPEEAEALLRCWGRFNAVRGVMGLAACLIFLALLAAG